MTKVSSLSLSKETIAFIEDFKRQHPGQTFFSSDDRSVSDRKAFAGLPVMKTAMRLCARFGKLTSHNVNGFPTYCFAESKGFDFCMDAGPVNRDPNLYPQIAVRRGSFAVSYHGLCGVFAFLADFDPASPAEDRCADDDMQEDDADGASPLQIGRYTRHS